MSRPKKEQCFERVQVYLPKETLKKLELTDFIKKQNWSQTLRNYINSKIEKDNSYETNNNNKI